MAVAIAGHAPPSDDRRWKVVDARMRRLGYRPDALVEALHSVQESFGFLDRDALEYVAGSLRCRRARCTAWPPSTPTSRSKPPGVHTCVVCMGTACYINGATKLLDGIVDASASGLDRPRATARSRS